MSQKERKQNRINAALEAAAKVLEAEGVKFFMGVVDRDRLSSDGGKAYIQSDVTGEDMEIILDMALPRRQDLINLGIWLGRLINSRSKKS